MSITRRDLLKVFAGVSSSIVWAPSVLAAEEFTDSLEQDCLSSRSYESFLEDITGIRDQCDSLGLEDIDFDDLYLGNRIPTYIFTDHLIKNYYYYPIINNSTILFWIVETDEGLQITCDLTEELKASVTPEAQFAILYDRNKAFAYFQEGQLIELLSYPDMPERGSLTPSTSFEDVETSSFGAGEKIPSLPASRAYNAYVSVPIVKQIEDKICWAATCASIVNSRNGTSYTAKSVAKLWYGTVNYNKPLPYADSAKVLKSLGLTYTYKSSVPTAAKVNKNLSSGFAIYGCWAYGTGQAGHATVIRGINSSNTLSLMDPLSSKFTTAKRSGSTWRAYSGGTGSAMTLKAVSMRYV